MITIDNVQFRNLEEQVLKNQDDIADIKTANQILNQFGIKVIGQVLDVSQLPDPTTYEGEYGDAYLVGEETPFDYYIYTRPNQFHETAFWLNIGEFPLAGPKGDTGETGPKGDTGAGSKWYASLNAPSTTEGINKQDQWLNTSDGNVYEFNGTSWILTGNIRGVQGIQGIQGIQGPIGPQGMQGIQGEKGDVGGFINIAGTVENVNQLPTPASLGNLTMAYLVGTSAPYTLYIQVGSTSDTAVWQNMGALNVATYITVNGQYVNILEMNNYQTKIRFIQLTGTSGQLSQANLTLLESDYSNYILLDNEKYVLNDIMSSEGYLIYTHTGRDSAQNLNIKTISIMLNNRTWSMVSNGVQKQLTAGNGISIENGVVSSSSNSTLLNSTKYNITINTQVPISKATLQQFSYILIEVEGWDSAGVARTSRATGYFKVSDLVEYNTDNDCNSIVFYSRRYALFGTMNFTIDTNNMVFSCEFAKPYGQTNISATAGDQIYIGNIWGIK